MECVRAVVTGFSFLSSRSWVLVLGFSFLGSRS